MPYEAARAQETSKSSGPILDAQAASCSLASVLLAAEERLYMLHLKRAKCTLKAGGKRSEAHKGPT